MLQYDDIEELAALEVEGRRVFVRADFDGALDARGELLDDAKLMAAAPTLRWLLAREARVVLAAHLGPTKRPPNPSIEACGARLAELLNVEIAIPDENLGPMADKLMAEQRPKQLLLLNNLADDDGELQADEDYARKLSAPVDIYVADGLFASERFASLTLLPKLCEARVMGLRLQAELSQLKAVSDAGAGTTWVFNGSFSERRVALERALERRGRVLTGAKLGATLLAATGGRSRPCPEDEREMSRVARWLGEAKDAGMQIVLPKDWSCKTNGELLERNLDDVTPRDVIVDLGSRTLEEYVEAITRASRVALIDSVGSDERQLHGTRRLIAATRTRHAGSYILADSASSAILRESAADEAVATAETAAAASASPDQPGDGSQPSDADQLAEPPRRAKAAAFVSTARQAVLMALRGEKLPALDALRIPR